MAESAYRGDSALFARIRDLETRVEALEHEARVRLVRVPNVRAVPRTFHVFPPEPGGNRCPRCGPCAFPPRIEGAGRCIGRVRLFGGPRCPFTREHLHMKCQNCEVTWLEALPEHPEGGDFA